jgi:hypothetical protein
MWEADVAVQFVKPDEAASVTRKVRKMAFGLYAQQTAPEKWQFIAFDPSFTEMPQQRWLLGIAGDRPVACE